MHEKVVWSIEQRRELKESDKLVFSSIKGKIIDDTLIWQALKRAKKKAGLTKGNVHTFRHTFASHYIMNGGDLLALKEVLGHSNLKMVERYAHLASAHKRRQINNLNGKFRICHLFATSQKSCPKKQKPTDI